MIQNKLMRITLLLQIFNTSHIGLMTENSKDKDENNKGENGSRKHNESIYAVS